MKRILFISALLFAALALSASPTKEEASSGGIIANVNVGTTAAIEKAVAGEYAYDMLASGVSGLPLVRQNGSGTFHPLVASFSTADAVTWTYTIVDGLTWSDGVPVTASDILFTLRYEDASGSANLVDQIASDGTVTKAKYVGYEVSGDGLSISLTLSEANVRELSNMTSFRIVPEHLYADGVVTDDDARVSCGPYVQKSFDKASGTIVFGINDYYPQKPNVETVTYRLFGNEDTMYMALQNGDVDMTFIYSSGTGSTYLEVLSGEKDISVISSAAGNAPLVWAFNNSDAIFSNEDLRRAISYALDYEVFASYVGGSQARVANKGFVPEATMGYKETEKLTTDLEKAASFMEKAGYRKADGRYVDESGKALSFSVTYRLDKANQVAAAELAKTQLEAFGISVTLDGLDSASYNAKTSNKFSGGNVTFQVALFGYTTAGMGMMDGLGTIYVDKNHAVQGGCQVDDPEFVEALGKLSSATTVEEYYAAAHGMQDFYAEHTPLVALYWDNMDYAVSSRFAGYSVDNVFGLNNTETWMNLTRN